MTEAGDGTTDGVATRKVALEAISRIGKDAYANLLLPKLLERSDLDQRDRGLVTELVYGTTRMQRSCDWLVDRFLTTKPQPAVRSALRLGAYQLAYTRIPAHAAVSATVGAVPKRQRGVVNAVLRKVATSVPEGRDDWPDRATFLSYPDWIIERFVNELGEDAAVAALETMNRAPKVTERADGYVQDTASQWVVSEVDAQATDTVLDLCAAPGGKATAMAQTGATVIAVDRRLSRTRLVKKNAKRLDLLGVHTLVADGGAPPLSPRSFDRVLVDAPCSGLGVLRRRADARWRIQPRDVTQLANVQARLLEAATALVRPGGVLVYSVCTLTHAETIDVAEAQTARPAFTALPLLGDKWEALGTGGRLLPQQHDTDGMTVFRWERSASSQ